VGPEAYTVLGALFLRTREENYEYKIRQKSEHLFRIRKNHNKLRTSES
jgi:hypothetical protein